MAAFAGVLFVLETLTFDLSATTAMPMLITFLSSSTLVYFLMGIDVQFPFAIAEHFVLSQLPFFFIRGVSYATISVYILRVTYRVESLLSRHKLVIIDD